MKKNIIIKTFLIAIILLITALVVYSFTPSGSRILDKFLGRENTPSITDPRSSTDVIEKARQYDLLYSLVLRNSLTPQCNWGEIEYRWEFPKYEDLNVYQAFDRNITLNDNNDKETYNTVEISVREFLSNNQQISENLSFDYIVEIYSKETSTYDKMPLFSETDGIKILASQLGIWRGLNNEYIAGLYETTNGYKQYVFDHESPEFSFPAKAEDSVKKEIT